MTSRERVYAALSLDIPDRIPYCELEIDEVFANKLLSRPVKTVPKSAKNRSIDEEKTIARLLGKDNIIFFFLAPTFCIEAAGKDGRSFYIDGVIKSKQDLKKVKLPNPHDKNLYVEAIDFVKGKEDFTACVVTNLGLDPVIKSMGLTTFSYNLYDDFELIEELLALYVNWERVVIRNLIDIGFDIVWAADDIAYKTGLIFSPMVFRQKILKWLKETASAIDIPWIFHTDGNFLEVAEELIGLGMNGLHPIDPNAVDIFKFKKEFGKRVCIIGNLNVDILAGSRDKIIIKECILELITRIGRNGGYIFSSGNSITSYCKIDNVKYAIDLLKQYGEYPIKL